MATRVPVSLLAALTAVVAPAVADAAPAEPAADATDRAATGGGAPLSRRRDRPWISRWAPERNTLEAGVWAGILIPARDLELFEADRALPDQGFRPLARAAPDFGLRLGYYPLSFFGVEAEGGAMPTSAEAGGSTSTRATLWTLRAHAVAQLGLRSITPFVLVGTGAFAVASERSSVGNDVDPSLHVGLGVKAYLSRRTMLRLDFRDIVTSRQGIGKGATNTLELLLGFSVVLGRRRDVDTAPPGVRTAADRDGDGFLDREDECPTEPGPKPTGCPRPSDRDADGFTDAADACPDAPGIAPDGCPDRDPDKDTILDPEDKCPSEPETKNGFEDKDGCPDALPEEVEKFEGTLEGVNFDFGADTLRAESTAKLDTAVDIMSKHPSVRIEIIGHTDSVGSRDANMLLSERRAAAVKRYLVERGISADRIDTRGAGPDEPIDSNLTGSGRARNRRIEFKVRR